MSKIANDLGFTKQRFRAVDKRQDPEKVAGWRSTKLPGLKKKAHEEGRIIHFQDEAAICLMPVMRATYAKRGKTPILPVNDSKRYKHLSISAFISENGASFIRAKKLLTLFLIFRQGNATMAKKPISI